MNDPLPYTPTLLRSPRPGALSAEEIFPDADFLHRLKLARSKPADFFGAWPGDDTLRIRRHLELAAHPERHAPSLPEAEPLAAEAEGLAREWHRDISTRPSAWLRLAHALAPDVILLGRAGVDALPRMLAASVCFPSSWCPEEKLGLPLAAIHQPVPDLNSELGRSLDAFLDRLRPGTAWLRANWGLTASPDPNQHPARSLPRLRAPLDPTQVWMRIEHQALLAMPVTGGILFGIRLEIFPLLSLRAHPDLAAGVARSLRTMPEAMARYKGLNEVRQAAADLIEIRAP